MSSASRPVHGGRLRAAAHDYRIPLQRWVDLSTGINPQGWAVPALPPEVWQRLPEEDDGLNMACLAYFGGVQVLPVAGSQAAIQAIPQRVRPCRVAILSPCYAEHEHAWRMSGHTVDCVPYEHADATLTDHDVLVLTNPNNPTGRLIDPATLLQWQARLAQKGGLLVVDEAFMDATPQHSLIAHARLPGLIILRSLGKFFGLAGVRCGFVAAAPEFLAKLAAHLGPWAVSHPARWVAQRALADRPWQQAACQTLLHTSERLATLLTRYGLRSPSGCAFFRWVPHEAAEAFAQAFARQAVLVRAFPEHGGLRFGLPHHDAHWQQLEAALQEMTG